ncbi:nuclear transport factor 2 family protein [Pleurocapsales cyanobacterium LEGE 10410]|nr:nuclear transport factor 2 family protein [Pleurocapsales cyanobacterium LEGE 10410]
MTLAVNPSNSFNVTAPDEAAIHTIVESVANLADRGNFESLEKLYAEEVEVDYTSAFGGEVELKSPQALMTQWASTLPGFDRTRHQISNIETKVKGDKATATADVTANHYLNDDFWQIAGSYEYGLVKEDGQWVIDKMTFTAESETGSRDVINNAVEQAKVNPSTYLQSQQTKQAVIDFLKSLEDKDMDKLASVWSEDAVQDMPFSPEGFPKRVEGKANLIQHYAAWPEISGQANFTDNLVFYPMQDSTMVFAEWRGDVEIIPTGRQYKQRYGGLFYVVDGKIELFREYYDPIVFQYAFDLEEDRTSDTLGK